VRGLDNVWIDIHEAPGELGRLLDVLVDMNLYAIERYSQAGADGYMFCDDWGLQDRLMISPKSWRELWKPRYARIYKAAHDAGLLTFLHSCGNIVDILDDFIEIGLDVIQMDQQENMGLDLLGERFGGRITFWCPVDIQRTMVYGTLEDIRAYCRRMVKTLGRPEGGFIAMWYSDPAGAGHRQEALDAMCDEFLKISREHGRVEQPAQPDK
jgi:uroporphyrinogen-III decarboxylase